MLFSLIAVVSWLSPNDSLSSDIKDKWDDTDSCVNYLSLLSKGDLTSWGGTVLLAQLPNLQLR